MSHPDTAGPDVVNAKEEFHAISTAYKVLTKPELKKQYDAARQQVLGSAAAKSGFNLTNPRNVDINSGARTDMKTSVNLHEIKHEGMMRNLNTGSDWTELRDKYRNEKWHKLSVDKKKVCDYVLPSACIYFCFSERENYSHYFHGRIDWKSYEVWSLYIGNWYHLLLQI